MNEGKRWEDNFRKALNRTCIRLYDTTNGFAGVKNPADFIYYIYPFQYLFELKSVQDERLDFSHITKNQWENFSYFSTVNGVNPILCVEFRKHKECYAIPFKVVERVNKSGKRSINRDYCMDCGDIVKIPAIYMRTNCTIDTEKFNNILLRMAKAKVGDSDDTSQFTK